MGKVPLTLAVISLSLTFSRCHLIWSDASQLQPVHGLYIKPSVDGTTGDLFVAATENTGVKSQWLTDQPINFLPSATQLQPTAVPLTLTSSVTKTSTPQEESVSTQKRAIVTSPPINYAYALPFPTSDGNVLAPYPYAVAASTEGASTPACEGTPASPYSAAFQYFYPQMMAAISRAMSNFNGADTKEKGSNNAAMSLPPFWPQAYTYPYQYFMLDPNTWAQNQKETTSQSQAETNSNETS